MSMEDRLVVQFAHGIYARSIPPAYVIEKAKAAKTEIPRPKSPAAVMSEARALAKALIREAAARKWDLVDPEIFESTVKFIHVTYTLGNFTNIDHVLDAVAPYVDAIAALRAGK